MFQASDDTEIEIRVVGLDGDEAGTGQMSRAKQKSPYFDLESVLGVVKQVANKAVGDLTTGDNAPCEVSLRFGLTLGGRTGVPVFAEVSGAGSVEVGLTWRHPE
jgi:hypothetical protein